MGGWVGGERAAILESASGSAARVRRPVAPATYAGAAPRRNRDRYLRCGADGGLYPIPYTTSRRLEAEKTRPLTFELSAGRRSVVWSVEGRHLRTQTNRRRSLCALLPKIAALLAAVPRPVLWRTVQHVEHTRVVVHMVRGLPSGRQSMLPHKRS